MKKYDYKLARKIIDKYVELDVLERAVMGMHEDWFWTTQTVWSNGEYKHPLPENIDEINNEFIEKRKNGLSFMSEEYDEFNKNFIGGINSSNWATPIIQVELKDGSLGTFRCYVSDGEELPVTEKISKEMFATQGALSLPVREWRDKNISIGDFKCDDDE